MAERKSIDCRDYPSEKGCTLKISGTEQEVLDAAVQHARSARRRGAARRLGARPQRPKKVARAAQINAQRRERLRNRLRLAKLVVVP